MSLKLTNYENHRTSTEYENNYITKRFLLRFLSFSIPLIMILYINDNIGLPCWKENSKNLIRIKNNYIFVHSK